MISRNHYIIKPMISRNHYIIFLPISYTISWVLGDIRGTRGNFDWGMIEWGSFLGVVVKCFVVLETKLLLFHWYSHRF